MPNTLLIQKKLRPTAHVPPRLPPCNRRRNVLPLVTDEAVFVSYRTCHQCKCARDHVRVLSIVCDGVAAKVEEIGH